MGVLAVNLAVTDFEELMVTEQVVPELLVQLLQLVKVEPGAGSAFRATTVFAL
jgi:hypothetical protein